MKTLDRCPICSHTVFDQFLTVKDYTVSKQSFEIVACNKCGFKFTNPRPIDSKLGLYYKSENYISHSDTRKGIVSKLYHVVRRYALKKKVGLIQSYVSRGTLLDYGCGTGAFAQACLHSGWKVTGVEPDNDARKLASEKGIEVMSGLDKTDNMKSFDAITLWHVMEHIPDLQEKINAFYNLLSQGGKLFVAVPNYKSHDANHYGPYWAAYDVPRHLSHFDQKTMQLLCEGAGFRLVKVLPMVFDSFYVSILSEQYKTGKKGGLLNAFLQGYKSNRLASRTGEYSSLIYIFTK